MYQIGLRYLSIHTLQQSISIEFNLTSNCDSAMLTQHISFTYIEIMGQCTLRPFEH